MRVREDLRLDVARAREVPLDVDLVSPERELGLPLRAADRVYDLRVRADHLEAAAATAERRLDRDRVAVLLPERAHLFDVGDRVERPRNERRLRGFGHAARADLVAHLVHRVRGWADENEAGLLDRAHEVGVLGEEAVAGVDGLGAGLLPDGDDLVDVEVALRRGGLADVVGFVGQLHVERVAVRVRVHHDRVNAQVTARADDADGDLSAVSDEHLREHGQGRVPARD